MVNNSFFSTTTTLPLSEPVNSSEGILKGILYGFMAFVVFFINLMVVISYILKKQKRGILDIFMLSFAFSSILTSLFVLCIVAYVRATDSEKFIGLMTECTMQYFFGTMLRLTDVATTTVIAVDRFVSVYKPILYRTKVHRKQGYIACGVIWFSAAFIAFIPFMTGDEIRKDMESLCTADWTTSIAYIVLVTSYTQFVIVLLCYVGIFKSIKDFIKRHKSISKNQELGSPTSTKKNIIEDTKDPVCSLSSNSSIDSCPDYSDALTSFSNLCYETEIADRLVKLSRNNIQAALRHVERTESIKFESNLKFKTKKVKDFEKGRKRKQTSSSIDLRIKAAVNHVSWSDLPEDNEPNNLKRLNSGKGKELPLPEINRLRNKTIKPILRRSQTMPIQKVQFNDDDDEVFDDKITSPVKRSKTMDRPRPTVKKSVSVLIKEKWKTKKVRRRSSTIRHFWRESQHFAKVMGVIVFLFYISWLPLAISINVVLASGNQTKYHDSLWICYNLSLISSVAIPIAYAVMCKPYRASYKKLWHILRHLPEYLGKKKKNEKVTFKPTAIFPQKFEAS